MAPIFAVDADGSDLVQILDCEIERPRFSPDGSRLVFSIVMSDGSFQVATSAADGSDLQVLTSVDGYAETPDWSPDGSWIVYAFTEQMCASFPACTSQEGVNGPPYTATAWTPQALWRINADGSAPRQIGESNTYDWEPRISPDGREVVFTRSDPADEFKLTPMIRDLTTGKERVVTGNATEPEHPEWSPDGEFIVYNTVTDGKGQNLQQIERVPANDRKAKPAVLDGSNSFKPTYSPNGSGIVFGCGGSLCRMKADGTGQSVLLQVEGVELNHFTWGPAES